MRRTTSSRNSRRLVKLRVVEQAEEVSRLEAESRKETDDIDRLRDSMQIIVEELQRFGAQM